MPASMHLAESLHMRRGRHPHIGIAVVLAEARAGHNAADGPVLCAQTAGRAAIVSRSGWRSSLGAW